MNYPCLWPPAPRTGHLLVDFSFSTHRCHTQEPLGPFLAPSPFALHVAQVSPTPVARPPPHPGLFPKLRPCSERNGVVDTQGNHVLNLMKWQHQPSWALVSPTALTNQPPSSVLLNSPSHSFKCAFSFLSPYNSPQTAVNPSLGTLRAHSV